MITSKLVRDHTERYLMDTGQVDGCEFRVALKGQYIGLLYARLSEEVNELVLTETPAQKTEGIGDILDVIDAIRTAENIPLEVLEFFRKEKQEKQGGYSGRVIQVTMVEQNKELQVHAVLRAEGVPSRLRTDNRLVQE